jgi:hypothetical protein
MKMWTRISGWNLVFLAIALSPCWSQVENGQSQPVDEESQVSVALESSDVLAQPQTQEDSRAPLADDSSVEAPSPTRSFFVGSAYVNESAESNATPDQTGGAQFYSVTRATGSANLVKFWRRAMTAIDYTGGGIFYQSYAQPIQELSLAQRFLWRRGQLTLRDNLGDLPGGSFGAPAFGGAGLYNLIFANSGAIPVAAGTPTFFGSSGFGGTGIGSNLTNVALVEASQELTGRSTLTIGGAYGLTAYFGDTKNLIDNREIAALADYSYQLSSRSQIGVFYGYRDFQFPHRGLGSGDVINNIAQLVFVHRLSGRMTFLAGAGPEFTTLRNRFELLDGIIKLTATSKQINVSARGSLVYRLPRTTLALSYDRLVTSGSGFFAGANSDIVQFSMSRHIWRSWNTSLDAGYVQLSSIGSSALGAPGKSFAYGYIGANIDKKFGRHFGASASYQFNDQNFADPLCVAAKQCTTQRNVFLIGVHWNTRPIPLEHGFGRDGETDNN